MIGSDSVLAIIPARAGSKGIPEKNLAPLMDKPLIAWTIESAHRSKILDRVIVSTDCERIAHVSRQYDADVPFLRPAELAQDASSTTDVILHAIAQIEQKFTWIVLLQPTSPLRTSQDIDTAIRFCIEKNAPACVSVSEPNKSPFWMVNVDPHQFTVSPLFDELYFEKRRQELPQVYCFNGAIFIAKSQWFISHRTFVTSQTVGYIMPSSRSVDIDGGLDLHLASTVLQEL